MPNTQEVYLNLFEDLTDPLERRLLAQRIVDLIALRPRLDLQERHRGEFSGRDVVPRSRNASSSDARSPVRSVRTLLVVRPGAPFVASLLLVEDCVGSEKKFH